MAPQGIEKVDSAPGYGVEATVERRRTSVNCPPPASAGASVRRTNKGCQGLSGPIANGLEMASQRLEKIDLEPGIGAKGSSSGRSSCTSESCRFWRPSA